MGRVLVVLGAVALLVALLAPSVSCELSDKIAYGVFKDLTDRQRRNVQRFKTELQYFKPTVIEVSGLTIGAVFYDDEGIELKTIQMDTFDVGDMIYTYTSNGFVYCPPGVDCPDVPDKFLEEEPEEEPIDVAPPVPADEKKEEL